MSRWSRCLIVLALVCFAGAVSAAPPQPHASGICLGPWECMNWCFERGCLTTTGCDPSTDGCFCANCS